MEELIQKQGPLYIQRKRFRMKWEMVWSIIRQASGYSVAKMEIFSCKGLTAGCMERSSIFPGKMDSVIPLCDCTHVARVGSEVQGCPNGFEPFAVHTAGKSFVFATSRPEVADWIQKLCETTWLESGEQSNCKLMGASRDNVVMRDNPIYSSWKNVAIDFMTTVKGTEASQKCGLQGPCILTVGIKGILLRSPQTQEVLIDWPYHSLRNFGYYKSIFHFEAGRHCASGEGKFKFRTNQNRRIIRTIMDTIKKHEFELRECVNSVPYMQATSDPTPAFTINPQARAGPEGCIENQDRPYQKPADQLPETLLSTELRGLVLDGKPTASLENTVGQLQRNLRPPIDVMPTEDSGISYWGVASGDQKDQIHMNIDSDIATACGFYSCVSPDTNCNKRSVQVACKTPHCLYASVEKRLLKDK